MDNKIYNKVITIESKEESKTQSGNTMVRLTDHTGEKFTFFKKKQDGTSTSVAGQFKDMDLDEGSTAKIGYVIENYQDKQGVTRESKKIINFQETNDNSSQSSQEPQSSNGGAYTASQVGYNSSTSAPIYNSSTSAPMPQRNFDKEAVGKCQSLFLQAYIQSGHSFSEAMLQVTPAKRLAEAVVYGHTMSKETVSPDIQEQAEQMASEDDGYINVSDVPF